MNKFKTGDLIRNVVKASPGLRLAFLTRYGDLAIVLGESDILRGVQLGAPHLVMKIHHQRINKTLNTDPEWWELAE